MTTLRSFIACVLLLVSLFSATAATYTLQISDIAWTGGSGSYNCFSGAAYPNTVNFTITKTANGRQNYAVTAGPSKNTGTYTRQLKSGANRLNYQMYTTSGMNYVLKAPTVATANEVISGSLVGQAGQVLPLSFVFYIPPGQVVPPGSYTDQLTISIYNAYNSVGSPYDTRTISVTAVVAAGAAVSIVPTGSSFNSSNPQLTLNFGALSLGQNQSCDVLIKQNNNCTVYYSSANNGVLKQVPTPTADQIPYTCVVFGSALDLTHSGSLPLPSGVSPGPDGNRYPLTVTIGDPSNASAGTYQDQITITVQAQ